MKKNIRDFADGRRKVNSDGGRSTDSFGSKLDVDAETAEAFAKKYQGKSEAEIADEIKRVAAQGKADGSLDMNRIENFAESLTPVLNREQKKKLDEIMSFLKK